MAHSYRLKISTGAAAKLDRASERPSSNPLDASRRNLALRLAQWMDVSGQTKNASLGEELSAVLRPMSPSDKLAAHKLISDRYPRVYEDAVPKTVVLGLARGGTPEPAAAAPGKDALQASLDQARADHAMLLAKALHANRSSSTYEELDRTMVNLGPGEKKRLHQRIRDTYPEVYSDPRLAKTVVLEPIPRRATFSRGDEL